nr:conotoxin precursor O1 [Conus judaeus]
MKLTYALIVAMLFLMACQHITTDDSRGEQKYLAKRSKAKIQNFKLFKLTKRCDDPGADCEYWENNCCGACQLRGDNQPICSV